MTKELFIKNWNESSDFNRIGLCRNFPFNDGSVLKVNIDNDDVYVTFENDEDTTLSFDTFGYELLLTAFEYMDINVDFV